MRRSQVAALVIGFLVAAGGSGAAWWLYANHKLPAFAGRLGIPSTPFMAQAPSARAPTTQAPLMASREIPAAPKPAAPPARSEPAPSARVEVDHPSFDIVRVEPRGDAVVAGKGSPNAKVTLKSGGKVVGEAKADASGHFVILPPPLAPGDYDLTLHQQPESGAPAGDSVQSVAVSLPKPGKGSIVVALAEPGKATKLLSTPTETPGPAPPAQSAVRPDKLAIRSAELENGTGLFVSGAAAAGAQVRVYLNDAHIADVVAGSDGAWSVRVKKGLTGGHYVVRADLAGSPGGTVATRAEVPFDVPTAMAAAPPASPAASATATPPAASAPSVAGGPATAGAAAVLDEVATARVTTGDNLWNISRFRLGDGKRYTQIYAVNAGQIRDPDLIYPGQVFVVPAR